MCNAGLRAISSVNLSNVGNGEKAMWAGGRTLVNATKEMPMELLGFSWPGSNKTWRRVKPYDLWTATAQANMIGNCCLVEIP
eukprot:5939328-Pleurochrysis_carterae.AAC.1